MPDSLTEKVQALRDAVGDGRVDPVVAAVVLELAELVAKRPAK